MTAPDERRAWVVGAVKIPYEQRDIAHAVLTLEDDRGFFNVIGADDAITDGHTLAIGENVAYRVELTDEEAELFRQASNCRYVEPDGVTYEDVGAVSMPAASSMRFMRADFARVGAYHGRDVLIGMLDGGTTQAVRNYLGITMVARQVFSTDQPGADEITSDHGCKVVPCLVPQGGRFLDAVVSENNGSRSVSGSCAAAVWCADQGAKVINYSASGTVGSSAWTDMLDYLATKGAQFFCSAGNDGLNQINYPAGYSTTKANCHSSIAFDEITGTRSVVSNYDNTLSGCAPGQFVLGLTPEGTPNTNSGTSMSAPHMALLCAMGMTGGRFSANQVGAALKANTRDTGQPAEEQGGGAYDLEKALTALGGFTNLPAQSFRRNLSPNPSAEVDLTGYSLGARSGITTTGSGRSSTITTPFGTWYVSVIVVGNGSTSTDTPDVEVNLPTVAVTPNKPYVFSVHSRIQTAGPTLQWWVRWENDSGTSLGESVGAKSPTFSTVWARYTMTATSPMGATKAVLRVRGWGFTSTSSVSWRLDGFQYEQASALGTYFDGSTAGASWDGTANNSTSTVGTATTGAWMFSQAAKDWLANYIATHPGTGTGGGPVGVTMPEILRLGKADGLTKVNLGVDYKSGEGPSGKQGQHVDHTLAEIENNLVIPNYAEIVNGAVRLTAYVGAATTPNSAKSRTEYRELAANGIDRAAWDARQGRHYLWVKGAIIKFPTNRKRMCIGQLHDAEDDVCMILADQGTNVESTFGDTGRPGRLTSTLELGKVYEWGIEVVREGSQTLLKYYWEDSLNPKVTIPWPDAGPGCYFKFGNYQQSEPQYDSNGTSAILDLHDSEIWHTGYPAPRARRGGSTGGGGTTSGIGAVVAMTQTAYDQLATKDPRTLYLIGALDGLAFSSLLYVAVLSEAQYGAIATPAVNTFYILVEGLTTAITLDSIVPLTMNEFNALTAKNPRAFYLVRS